MERRSLNGRNIHINVRGRAALRDVLETLANNGKSAAAATSTRSSSAPSTVRRGPNLTPSGQQTIVVVYSPEPVAVSISEREPTPPSNASSPALVQESSRSPRDDSRHGEVMEWGPQLPTAYQDWLDEWEGLIPYEATIGLPIITDPTVGPVPWSNTWVTNEAPFGLPIELDGHYQKTPRNRGSESEIVNSGTPRNEIIHVEQLKDHNHHIMVLSPTPPLLPAEMNEDPTDQIPDFQAERCIPHELLEEERMPQLRNSLPPTVPVRTPTNATTKKRVWSESLVGQADLSGSCDLSPLDPSDSARLEKRMRVKEGTIPEVQLAPVAQSGQRRGRRANDDSVGLGNRRTERTGLRNAPAPAALRMSSRNRQRVNYCELDLDDLDNAKNKKRRKNSKSSNGKRVKKLANRYRSVRMTPADEKEFQEFLATQAGPSTREAHFRETDALGQIWITMTNQERALFEKHRNREQ